MTVVCKMFIGFTAISSRIVSNFKLMFQLPIIRPLNSEKEPVEKLLACSCRTLVLYIHIRTVPCFVSNMCFISDVDVFSFLLLTKFDTSMSLCK